MPITVGEKENVWPSVLARDGWNEMAMVKTRGRRQRAPESLRARQDPLGLGVARVESSERQQSGVEGLNGRRRVHHYTVRGDIYI